MNGAASTWQVAALAWRYLWARPMTAALNAALLALGLASMVVLMLLPHQLTQGLSRDAANIDLVVGAKGSPMQLILAGVFHLDAPTGNVKLADVQALRQRPEVKSLIPLSLGDAYNGFRIVGTTPDYAALYGARVASGNLWAKSLEVVLGSEAAGATGLAVGSSFAGSHGLGGGSAGAGRSHDHAPFRVVGVLAPCACVLDRLILTSTESVWDVHGHHAPAAVASPAKPDGHDGHDDHDDHDHATNKHTAKPAAVVAPAPVADTREVTLALVQYRSPLAAVSFPRWVNSQTGMQAAAPALEIARLMRLVGVSVDAVRALAWVLLAMAALSVLVALWNSVRERRADLAMLRMLGAPPGRLFALLWFEALWLAIVGGAAGLLLGHGLTAWLGQWLAAERSVPITGWLWLPQECALLGLAIALATLAALLPALSAYRADAGEALASR